MRKSSPNGIHWNGQIAFVAEKGNVFTNDQGRRDARLRVIFDNGTESNMLRRSLQRQLNAEEAGRRITNPDIGPLFGVSTEDSDLGPSTIYVLRSLSKEPFIAGHREVIHKIGVTGNHVDIRTAAAKTDPTFLFAEVEVIANYKLFNVNRVKLENVLHKFFESARLDMQIPDNFGREWFLVPLDVIDEAMRRIKDGSIIGLRYDRETAKVLSI